MNKINVILDSLNPTDSFVRKNNRIKEALAFTQSAPDAKRPNIMDVMRAAKK